MHAIDKLSLQSWLSSELEQYGIDSRIYARHILDLFFNSGYKTDLLLSERERNIFSYITDCPKKNSKLKRKAESRSNSFPCTCDDDDEVWKKQMAVERLLAAADDDVAASNINNIKDLIEKLHDLIKALKDESDSDDARRRMKKPKENYNQAFPSLLLRPVTLQHISNTAWNKYHIIKLEQEESDQAPVADNAGNDEEKKAKETCLLPGVRVITSQAHSKQTRLSNRERRHPYVKKKKKQALAKTHHQHHQQQRKNRSKQQMMAANKSGKVRSERSSNTPLDQLSSPSPHPTTRRLPLFEKMSQQKRLTGKPARVSSPEQFDVSGRRSKTGASSGRNSFKHNSRQQQKWYNKEDGVKDGEANKSNHKRLPFFHRFNNTTGCGRWKDDLVRSAPTDDEDKDLRHHVTAHNHHYSTSRDEQFGLLGGRRRGDKFVYPSYEEYMRQQFGATVKNSSSSHDDAGGSIWNHYYLPVSMRSDFVGGEEEEDKKKRSKWFRDPLTGLLNFIPAASSHLFISECDGDNENEQVEVWKYCPSPNLWQPAPQDSADDVGLEGGRSSRLETIYTSATLLDALDSIAPHNDDSNDEVIRREWQQYEAIFTQIQSATPGPNAIGAGGDCGEDNGMVVLNKKSSATILHLAAEEEEQDEACFLRLADVDKNDEEGSVVGISKKLQDDYHNSPWHQHSHHVLSDSLVNVDKWLSEMMHHNNSHHDDNKLFTCAHDLLADNKHSAASSVKMMTRDQHQITKSTADDVFSSSSPLSSSSTFFHHSTSWSNKLNMEKNEHFTSSSTSSSGDYHLFTSSSSYLASPPNISSRSSSLWTEEEEVKKVNKCDDDDNVTRHLISDHHNQRETYKQAVNKQHGCDKQGLSARLDHLHIFSQSQSRDKRVVDEEKQVDSGLKWKNNNDGLQLNYSSPCDVGNWWKASESPNLDHQHSNKKEDEVGCDGGVRACAALFNIFNFNLFNLTDFPLQSSSNLPSHETSTRRNADDDDAVKLKDLDKAICGISHTEVGCGGQEMEKAALGRSSLAQHNMNNNSTAVAPLLEASSYNLATMSCGVVGGGGQVESGELSDVAALIESCVNSHNAWKTRVRMSNIWEWVSGIRPVDVLYNEKQQGAGETVTLQPSALTHFRPIRCKESAAAVSAESNASIKMSANNDEVWWNDKHQQQQQSWLDPILLKRDNENVNAVEGLSLACTNCEPPDTVENEISDLLKVVTNVDKQQQQQQHCTCNNITSQHDERLITDTYNLHHRPTGEDKCLQTSFEQQIQLIDHKLRCELSIRPLKANSR